MDADALRGKADLFNGGAQAPLFFYPASAGAGTM